MKCFVINLPRSIERLSQFVEGWNAPFDYQIFDAIDGNKLNLPSRWKHEPGHYGLNLTYITIFSEMLRQGQSEPFAVFEDDALFYPEWYIELERAMRELPEEWYYINLGPDLAEDSEYGKLKFKPKLISPELVSLRIGWRTHAIVYNPIALTYLLDMLFQHPWPVDQVWCHYILRGTEYFLATRKFLVGTRGGISVTTDKVWPDCFVGQGLGKPIC
jgi:GR25 family glycosyltransferase involved in LPS biosynthesis